MATERQDEQDYPYEAEVEGAMWCPDCHCVQWFTPLTSDSSDDPIETAACSVCHWQPEEVADAMQRRAMSNNRRRRF